MDPDRIGRILEGMEGRSLLVVGDLMLDCYQWGEVARISPEAPVPVVEVHEETSRLGGAANVAANVRALGAIPRLVGVVGEDAAAHRLREELERESLDGGGILADASRPTSLKTRVVARGQHVVRTDRESREELDGEREAALGSLARTGLEGASAVIISDYGKGVVTRSLLEILLPEARRRGIPVCVDPKDTHFNSYMEVAIITPNQYEAAEVLGFKLRDEASLARAGQVLLDRLRAEGVLITRGAEGMSLFERGGRRTDYPVAARRVYDVTGAGDTVVSSYAVALAGGAEPREAALIATHAAGLVVGEVGTAVPDRDRLRRSLAGEEP
jgi:D-beta-D-heptose 7-phosphate kinase/D-beta-D-heptose 1-phosphate adenosyltransferase